MTADRTIGFRASHPGWKFDREGGIVVDDAVSTGAIGLGGNVRLYVTRNFGMAAYHGSNGRLFTLDEGSALPSGTDPTVIPLPDGRFRMYFIKDYLTGKYVYSALSKNARAWTEEGDRFRIGLGAAGGVPDAVILPDGRVRIYYVNPAEQIVSATSADGLSFSEDALRGLPAGYVDPAVTLLSDGTWLMVVSNSPRKRQALYVATSEDGLEWELQEGTVYSKASLNALDPAIVRLPGSSERFRVYFSIAKRGRQLEGPFDLASGILTKRRVR